MGLRGPAPKPNEIKQKLGLRVRNQQAPQPPAALDLAPPEFLPPVAAEEWNRAAPLLAGLGLLTEADLPALALYCESFATFVEAAEFIQENGATFETPKGYVAPRPEVAIKRNAAELILKFAAQFGMTPSSRARIIVSLKPEQKTTLEDILDGGD